MLVVHKITTRTKYLNRLITLPQSPTEKIKYQKLSYVDISVHYIFGLNLTMLANYIKDVTWCMVAKVTNMTSLASVPTFCEPKGIGLVDSVIPQIICKGLLHPSWMSTNLDICIDRLLNWYINTYIYIYIFLTNISAKARTNGLLTYPKISTWAEIMAS